MSSRRRAPDVDGLIVARLLGAARRPTSTADELVDIARRRVDLIAQALAISNGPGEWQAAAPWAVERLREAIRVVVE